MGKDPSGEVVLVYVEGGYFIILSNLRSWDDNFRFDIYVMCANANNGNVPSFIAETRNFIFRCKQYRITELSKGLG